MGSIKMFHPVGCGCRIHRLHFCKEVRLPNENLGFDTKHADSDAPILELWGIRSTPLLPLLPRPL